MPIGNPALGPFPVRQAARGTDLRQGLSLLWHRAQQTSGLQLRRRPVIYLPDAEGNWIPQEEKWRHVRFEAGQVDFTHEREWRVPVKLDLGKFVFYVIVWTAAEAKEIRKVAESVQLADRIHGILPMCDITKML